MVKVTDLTDEEIESIGAAFADYNYADGEKGMAYLYKDGASVKKYICGYTRAMLKAGLLYSTSENHEAFIAFKHSDEKMNFSGGAELLKAIFGTMGFVGTLRMFKALSTAGESYSDTLKKAKQPYIFVGMLAVVKNYQGQGYMRKVLDIAFEEGRKRGCPVVLETDAALKKDKYVHLGMNNIRTRRVTDECLIYDLIKE